MDVDRDKTDTYCIPLNKSNGTLDRREKNTKLKEVRLNKFCIPESFNTKISHQFFDYTITFVNPQL